MGTINQVDLENILIKELVKLMKFKALPQLSPKELKDIVTNVAKAMLTANPNLTKEELSKQLIVDKSFIKTLKNAFMMAMINLKEPDLKKHFNLSILFIDKANKKDINEEKLKSELTKLLMKFYKLKPSDDKKDLDELVTMLTKSIMKEMKDHANDDPKLQNRTLDQHRTLNTVLDLLSDVIKMEYGGIDTRHPGSIAAVIQSISSDPNWVDNEPHIFTQAAIEHRRPDIPADAEAEKKSSHQLPNPLKTTLKRDDH